MNDYHEYGLMMDLSVVIEIDLILVLNPNEQGVV
jgi:hypothetical protein